MKAHEQLYYPARQDSDGTFTRKSFKAWLREPFDLIDRIIATPDRIVVQADGSTVYIQRVSGRGRRYNLVIEGEGGIVTGLQNVTPQELKNLARNYDWV